MPTTTMTGWYLGNLPSIESNPGSALGTYGDSSNIASESGLDIEANWTGSYLVENNPAHTLGFDTGDGPQTAMVEQVNYYNVTATLVDGSTANVRMWVAQTTDNQAILLHDRGSDNNVLETTAVESFSINSLVGTNYRLAPRYHTEEIAPACFCADVEIATPTGPRKVSDLQTSDEVLTLDNGAQPILWIGVQTLDFATAPRKFMPVEFKKDSLGFGLPNRDLRVSPQHRILIGDHKEARSQSLAASKAFLDQKHVRQTRSVKQVTYYSIMLNSHEIVFANGAPVESFFPGEIGIAGFDLEQAIALGAALKKFDPNAARKFLSVRQAKQILDKSPKQLSYKEHACN